MKAVFPFILLLSAASTNASDFTRLTDDFERHVEQGEMTHILDIDNDSLLMNRNDGFYTSGLRYARRYGLQQSGAVSAYGWRIGQEVYTASDIKLAPESIDPRDHPYAAWLFGGVFKETRRTDGGFFRTGLDLGCLGPCAGGRLVQTLLHRVLRQPLPQAWNRQIGNEWGAVLYAAASPGPWKWGGGLDLRPDFVGRFGNIYTDAAASLLARAGRLNALQGEPALHGFLRLDARAVAYNATMQGGFFSKDNVHTVDPKRLVGEAEIGVVWRTRKLGVRAGFTRRSSEVGVLSSAVGGQNYVRVQLTYSP